MRTAILIPAKDLIVRDPGTKAILAKEGVVKPLIGKEGRYWKRRLRDGSVTIGKGIRRLQSDSIDIKKIEKRKSSINKKEG